jgi:lipoprotein-anchoring transpeptidase ErfK/SrfK
MNGRFRPAAAATARRAVHSIRNRWRSIISRKYYNAPMPHAIFFHSGFAIHGTNDLARLGGPASHGCVRLHPSHAAALFALVGRNGPRHTRIQISN